MWFFSPFLGLLCIGLLRRWCGPCRPRCGPCRPRWGRRPCVLRPRSLVLLNLCSTPRPGVGPFLPGSRLRHSLGSRFHICGGWWSIAGTWLKRRLGPPSLEGPWRDCPSGLARDSRFRRDGGIGRGGPPDSRLGRNLAGLDGGLTRQRRLPRTELFSRRQLLNMSLLLRG